MLQDNLEHGFHGLENVNEFLVIYCFAWRSEISECQSGLWLSVLHLVFLVN